MINIEEVISEENEMFIFIDIDINSKDLVDKVIKKYERDFNITLEQITKNNYILEKLIKELKENYKIKYNEMANELGISLSKINRLVNKK